MKKLLRLYRKLKSDRWLLFEAFCWLNLVRLGLAFLSFSRLRRFIDKLERPTGELGQVDGRNPSKIINAIYTSDRYSLSRSKCLAKALVTKFLLSKSGYICSLKIGVFKTDQGTLEAHAWVEYENKIIMGNLFDLHKFVPITSL